MASLLGRLRAHFSDGHVEAHAAELRQDAAERGAQPISDLVERQPAVVRGRIRSLTRPTHGSAPSVVVEIFDGSRALNLVFVGRRSVAGLRPGATVTARGRICMPRGVPTIFNPAYEIDPSGH